MGLTVLGGTLGDLGAPHRLVTFEAAREIASRPGMGSPVEPACGQWAPGVLLDVLSRLWNVLGAWGRLGNGAVRGWWRTTMAASSRTVSLAVHECGGVGF